MKNEKAVKRGVMAHRAKLEARAAGGRDALNLAAGEARQLASGCFLRREDEAARVLRDLFSKLLASSNEWAAEIARIRAGERDDKAYPG